MTFINANVLSNFVSLLCLSFLLNALLQNTMAEQNLPAQPPTRTDEQIISVDILSNTNFYQAFTTSANIPAIYLQQFWKIMAYNEKTGVYSCQVDEQWFDLSADLLRKALAITRGSGSKSTTTKSAGKKDFGWRVTNPGHPVLQNAVGNRSSKLILITAEPDREEFSQGSILLSHTKQATKAKFEDPQRSNNLLFIHDYVLGNLKFVPKGESVEVFGMAIPDPLITEAIRQSSYYPIKPTSVSFHQKVRKESLRSNLVDEEDEAQQESILKRKMMILISNSLEVKFETPLQEKRGGREGSWHMLEDVKIWDPVSEANSQTAMSKVGNGKAVVTEEQVAHSPDRSVKEEQEL
ncbi:hypothetical protein Tco_1009750 [Tanacetum coccineum]